MELIPAIDLLGGRVVRLAQGAYEAVTDYGADPVGVARRWQEQGACRVHLVDLDAAREGRARQAQVIEGIVRTTGMAVQVAGGIRSADQARAALLAGADRVVLGSALIADPALAVALVAQHGPERIVAALDVRDGRAFGDGWVAAARSADVLEHARALAANGVRWFAVTAIARDGLMSGPDLVLLENVRKAVPDAAIIASGGVSSLDDIRQLASFGYDAAIIGRALYEGAFSLSEALATAERPR